MVQSMRHAQCAPQLCACQEVVLRATGEVLLQGELERGVVPSDSVWQCSGGHGEVRGLCIILCIILEGTEGPRD